MRKFWLSACLAVTLLGSVSLTSADAQWLNGRGYSPGYYNYQFTNPSYNWSITPYGSNYGYNPGSYTYQYSPPTYARPYYYGPSYYPMTNYYPLTNYYPQSNYYYPTYPSYSYSVPAYSYWR